MLSPPRIGSGQEKTGFSTQSDAEPGAWLVDEPSKPQIGRSAVPTFLGRILVFDRSLAVGSVPSIQMYSALIAIGAASFVQRAERLTSANGRGPARFPAFSRM